MEDWEDEPLPLSTKTERAKSSWGDEDEDVFDIRESWEDEDELVEPAPEPKISKNVTPILIVEDHLQERLVEKADSGSKKAGLEEENDDKTLNDFIPKSESDFSEYADLISHKLRLYEAVMRLSITALKAGDAKEVASFVAAIANEKLRNEKEANKKNIVAKKKQLQVDKETDDVAVDAYDDDYAFM